MTTMVTLISPPPPSPCTARKAISWSMSCAAPQSAEPSRKVATAPRKTRFAPRESQSLPYRGSAAVAASENALTSQGMRSMPCSGSSSRTIGTVAAETMFWSRTASSIVARQTAKPILSRSEVVPPGPPVPGPAPDAAPDAAPGPAPPVAALPGEVREGCEGAVEAFMAAPCPRCMDRVNVLPGIIFCPGTVVAWPRSWDCASARNCRRNGGSGGPPSNCSWSGASRRSPSRRSPPPPRSRR